MKVTFFGTTTLLFDDGKDQVLFDAHLTRPSLLRYIFGSASTDTALADRMIEAHKINRLRAIFISHTHHDHVMDAAYIAKKTGAVIYGTSSAMNVAEGSGVPEAQRKEFQTNEAYDVAGYRIRILSSIHSKPTLINKDLGVPIEKPLNPASCKLRDYHEGGSYDFYVEAEGKRFLIRPSFNYIEGQLDGIRADVLFLGVAGIAKETEAFKKKFFEETVEKVKPEVVIPVHWDNFFSPLTKPVTGMPSLIEKTPVVFYDLANYCEANDVCLITQIPRTSILL